MVLLTSASRPPDTASVWLNNPDILANTNSGLWSTCLTVSGANGGKLSNIFGNLEIFFLFYFCVVVAANQILIVLLELVFNIRTRNTEGRQDHNTPGVDIGSVLL